MLAGAGVPVFLIPHEAPTPLAMFTVLHRRLPYGLMVTASHNPALYNGVKLFTRGGRDATEDVTRDIGARANAVIEAEIPAMPYDEAMARGIVREIDPQNDYIDAIIRAIDMDAIREGGVQIVLDPMYGVSRASLLTILLTARCDVSVIHEQRDALFGGRLPAPSVQTLGALRGEVVKRRADIGIATDGDADRLGIIDDMGRFIHPNQILALMYYYLLNNKGWRGCAVRNLATTHLLDEVAAAFGETCVETPVGFKYISAAMREHDALIGGESSGGLAVRGHISGKDGIYAAALLVEMLCVTGKKLSELIEELYARFGRRYMTEYGWLSDEREKARLNDLLLTQKKLPEFPVPVQSVSYLDGVKVVFENGWLSARFSGTEPRMRIFCEMPTRAEAERLSGVMADFLGLKV